MAITGNAFLLSAVLIGNVASNNLQYTVDTMTMLGVPCLTDCDEKAHCWISYKEQAHCFTGTKKALTYYTTRDRYPDKYKCLSKCAFVGYDYSWCYIDQNFNWDYCNPNEGDIGLWYQYTHEYGKCSNKCGYEEGTSYLWCKTYWSKTGHWWDKCYEDYYYKEKQTHTVYGKKCYGDCELHGGTYYFCIDETESKEKCAPSAVRYVCPAQRKRRSVLSRQTRSSPPRRTVDEYNQDIDNDNTLTTVTLSTTMNPDVDNPVLDYTYRDLGNGIRLPFRIRARIRPYPYTHVKTKIARKSSDVSSGARTNCNKMGLNRCLPNNNNDQCGHLIPFILGGPSGWFNIVPQTQRINIGTATNSDMYAPSIWAITERTMRRWVEDGGSVEFEVLVAYDLPCTRPSGFGVVERYYRGNGVLDHECPGYWYSNNPYDDPDSWNN